MDNDTADNPTGVWNVRDNTTTGSYVIKGGTLLRACTANLKSDGSTSNFLATNLDCFYNFLLLPHDPTDASCVGRVNDIFKRESSEQFTPVIDGIVDMKITCYTLKQVSGVNELQSYNPMKNDGTIAKVSTSDMVVDEDLTTAADIGSIVSGTPFPVAVKIDLYVLAERDLREWLNALNSSLSDNQKVTAANKIKRERMRCFSKIIYLSNGR
jgi:hypothetical protein